MAVNSRSGFVLLFSRDREGSASDALPSGLRPNGIALALVAALLPCTALRAAEYEQKQGNAVLRLLVDKIEDDQVEARLSSQVVLTITIDGLDPLKVGDGDDEAVKVQVESLKSAGPWFREPSGKVKRTSGGDGRGRWELAITLDPAKDGKVELRPAPFDYTEGPDAVKHHVEWRPIALVVTSELASLDVKKELRDITPPEAPPGPPPSWTRWLPWAGIAVAVAGLVAGGWSLRRRLAVPAPPLTAHEWAARELERLEALHLPEAGEAERYHTLLSDVVRAYLERRFNLPASQQTTAEFLETMRRAPQLTPAQQGLLRDFLERCDMAKFARAAPPPQECRAVAAMARSFVQETTPRPT